ncbi:TetR/AcrR family transcriptional regulator [Nocardia acidivorans]|uniref:TetR/AcrR family transcriptional regulator n=1 Tax=Nocardia acidivorans TaxID=404580 RepID=UPI0008359541|nr:TetR/AcrR family transcriptional regulator [Nocardia acidivorans]
MPRIGLSTETIVSEAIRLADEVGFHRVTLTELAKRFGVAQPSLYKHLNGLDELQRLLALRMFHELASTLRKAATGKSGSDALRAAAHAYRAMAMSHPGCYEAILRAPEPNDGDAATAVQEVLTVFYEIFLGYDIQGDEAIDAARYLRSTLHGFVSLELAQGFAIPRPLDISFERLTTAIDATFCDWKTGYPTVSTPTDR